MNTDYEATLQEGLSILFASDSRDGAVGIVTTLWAGSTVGSNETLIYAWKHTPYELWGFPSGVAEDSVLSGIRCRVTG